MHTVLFGSVVPTGWLQSVIGYQPSDVIIALSFVYPILLADSVQEIPGMWRRRAT